jgi:hypothetical protein
LRIPNSQDIRGSTLGPKGKEILENFSTYFNIVEWNKSLSSLKLFTKLHPQAIINIIDPKDFIKNVTPTDDRDKFVSIAYCEREPTSDGYAKVKFTRRSLQRNITVNCTSAQFFNIIKKKAENYRALQSGNLYYNSDLHRFLIRNEAGE